MISRPFRRHTSTDGMMGWDLLYYHITKKKKKKAAVSPDLEDQLQGPKLAASNFMVQHGRNNSPPLGKTDP
jgi:hypothetical protein